MANLLTRIVRIVHRQNPETGKSESISNSWRNLLTPSKTLYDARLKRIGNQEEANANAQVAQAAAQSEADAAARIQAIDEEGTAARRRAALARNRLSTVLSPLGESVPSDFLGQTILGG